MSREQKWADRPGEGEAGSWYEIYGQRGAPKEGEEYLPQIAEAIRLWEDAEAGPWVEEVLEALRAGDLESAEALEGPGGFLYEDLAGLLGAPPGWSPDDAWTLAEAVSRALGRGDEEPDSPLVPEWVKIALVGQSLGPEAARKPRLLLVSKGVAEQFVRRHHSQLGDYNYRGLFYTLGVALGERLVAVATVNTPTRRTGTGKLAEDDPTYETIELTRIASDGTVRGASSMLAARALDLLPETRRFGRPGRLFLTYSLVGEAGHTYLALAHKGLRPVAYLGPQKASGARKGAGNAAKGDVPKIRWEAGPLAAPPDWQALLLHTPAEPEAVRGAQRAFAEYETRVAKEREKEARVAAFRSMQSEIAW